MGGGKGGGGEASEAAGEAARAMADLAQQYYAETAPVREPVISRLGQFMGGDFDVSASPLYKPLRRGVENTYSAARKNIMANLPAGGPLQEGLTTAEISRAGGLTDIMSQLGADEYSKAYSLASGSPQVAFSGLGSAASGYGASATGYNQAQANLYNLLGMGAMGAGMYFGGKNPVTAPGGIK